MKGEGSHRRALMAWAIVGAAMLVVAVLIALLVGGAGRGGDPGPVAATPGTSGDSSPSSAAGGERRVVDLSVADRGWVPEPITQDPDVYTRAALEAAATFDARRSTRAEWVKWLETWFTPSPLYYDQQDARDQMAGYKAELAQSVVLPQSKWDDLAKNDGHVSARVDGQVEYLDQPEATQKHMRTATANVVMTYTQKGDGTEGEVSYEQTVRVSVQVVCGGASTPTPGSEQRAGDCKVVRFFDAAVG